MKFITLVILPLLLYSLPGCSQTSSKKDPGENAKIYPAAKSKAYWKKILSPEAYEIMVNRGTETPFKNPYWDNHQKGVYVSAATGKPLFSSSTKFESGTGWPSFFESLDPTAIKVVKDSSLGIDRDEVIEASTGLHLGHVFDDGPKPTGKRFCMNSYALKFIKSK